MHLLYVSKIVLITKTYQYHLPIPFQGVSSKCQILQLLHITTASVLVSGDLGLQSVSFLLPQTTLQVQFAFNLPCIRT